MNIEIAVMSQAVNRGTFNSEASVRFRAI